MSVETALGISAEMAREIIERRWPDWVAASPALALVDFQDVRRWLRASDCKAAGDALHALAGLAAKSGGDDVEAATVLAWAMLPAACQIANQLRTVQDDIDALVASQLWIEIRMVNWRSTKRVTANISRNLRRNLLRQCGLDGRDPTSVEPVFWPELMEWLWPERAPIEDPLKLLLRVLDWGVANNIIDESDRDLLLDMVDASTADPKRRSPRRPLLASSTLVGPQLGVHPRTVRRRSRRAIDALAAHASELAELVDPIAS